MSSRENFPSLGERVPTEKFMELTGKEPVLDAEQAAHAFGARGPIVAKIEFGDYSNTFYLINMRQHADEPSTPDPIDIPSIVNRRTKKYDYALVPEAALMLGKEVVDNPTKTLTAEEKSKLSFYALERDNPAWIGRELSDFYALFGEDQIYGTTPEKLKTKHDLTASASLNHADIEVEADGRVFINDMDSELGTFVWWGGSVSLVEAEEATVAPEEPAVEEQPTEPESTNQPVAVEDGTVHEANAKQVGRSVTLAVTFGVTREPKLFDQDEVDARPKADEAKPARASLVRLLGKNMYRFFDYLGLVPEGGHDVGKRKHGHDYIIEDPDVGFYAVFDGVGSKSYRALTSHLAAGLQTQIQRYIEHDIDTEEAMAALRDALNVTNNQIRERLKTDEKLGAAAAWLMPKSNDRPEEREVVWASLGSPRLYWLPKNENLKQISEDEAAGDGALTIPGGPDVPLNLHGIQIGRFTLKIGDRLLLITDGVYDNDHQTDESDVLEDIVIEEILRRYPDPKVAGEVFVDAAEEMQRRITGRSFPQKFDDRAAFVILLS